MPELSSQLIGELVELNRYIQRARRCVRVCGLSPESRAMLEMCGLDDLCLAYETRQEAVLGSCDPAACRGDLAEDPRLRFDHQQTSSSLAISWTPATRRMASWAICF